MKKIKILHLYYDLLNMYGENGNIVTLVNKLEKHNVDLQVDFKSLNDKYNILDYDFIYMGSGDNEAYNLALNDLTKHKKELIEYINNNKFILATGNSINLFSELNILDFKVKQLEFRIVGEQVYNTNIIDHKIIGFQNRDTIIYDNNEEELFTVITGTGSDINSNKEGIKKNNFYGTYLLGPLLIRNPYLLEHIIKELLKQNNIEYKKIDKDISYKAYDEYLKNFVN